MTMERMPEGSIDVILTSPPYNISRAISERALSNNECKYGQYADSLANKEYIEWTKRIFDSFKRILAPNGVVLYNMSYGSESPEKSELMFRVVGELLKTWKMGDCIVWKKKTAAPNNVSPNHLTRICEFIFVMCQNWEYHANKKSTGTSNTGQTMYENVYNIIQAENNDGDCPIHKATFSTSLVFKLLELYGVPGGVCYDPFMGTGTTAIGCLEWGMNYIGSEIDQSYCRYAQKRVQSWLDEPKLW